MPSIEALHILLSNMRLDTFWSALWLELSPFFYYIDIALIYPALHHLT